MIFGGIFIAVMVGAIALLVVGSVGVGAFIAITVLWGMMKQEVKPPIPTPWLLVVADGLEWPHDLYCGIVRLITQKPFHEHQNAYLEARRKTRGEA